MYKGSEYRTMEEVAEACGVSRMTIHKRIREWKDVDILPNISLNIVIHKKQKGGN